MPRPPRPALPAPGCPADGLRRLLEGQQAALCAGDADALGPLEASLRRHLEALARGGPRPQADELAQLRQLAAANLEAAHRRLAATGAALQALAPALPGLKDLLGRPT